MKLIKNKNFLVIFLSIILTLTILTSILIVFFLNNNKNSNVNNQTEAIKSASQLVDESNGVIYLNKNAVDVITFDPTASYYSGEKTKEGFKYSYAATGVDYFNGKDIIRDEYYENYSTFIIEDETGLDIFADNVWYILPSDKDKGLNGQNSSRGRARSFVEKTVKLGSDIWCASFHGIGWKHENASGGAEFSCFAGTFDGCGFYISGLQLDGSNAERYKTNNYTYEWFGLFGCLSGVSTVKNLNLKNIFANSYFTDSSTRSYLGAIAGLTLNEPTIENCIVQDFDASFGDNDANKK